MKHTNNQHTKNKDASLDQVKLLIFSPLQITKKKRTKMKEK